MAQPAPTLQAMLAAQSVWHAARAPQAPAPGQPSGHAALDALLPQGGWPRGALVELLLPADGVGEVSLLLPLLARLTRAGETVAVVAPPYLPYAPAWQAAGVDLRRLEIVAADDARNALWAFEQCLRSAACAVVLGWPRGDAASLRRLQVAADAGGSLGMALRDRAHAANPSPAVLRLQCGTVAGGPTEWRVLKCRGGQPPARPFVQHGAASVAGAVGDAGASAPFPAAGVDATHAPAPAPVPLRRAPVATAAHGTHAAHDAHAP